MEKFKIRPLNKDDHEWVTKFLKEYWGSTRMVARGKLFQADELPGFAALQDNKPAGLITYRTESDQCEITTLNSMVEGIGIGSTLIDAVRDVAAEVAFLAMDLDHYGRADLSRNFVDAYVALSRDNELRQLLDFYKCYFAYVRGNVESFKLDDLHIPEEEKTKTLAVARNYFKLAESYI